MSARYIIGDVRDVMATIPDGSIDLVMTSPPFLALRSYLPADHPDKHLEIGSEPDPAAFLDTMLLLTAEWGRVLAPHGSICVELGDTYSGSGGAGGDYSEGGLRDGQEAFVGSAKQARNETDEWAGHPFQAPRRTGPKNRGNWPLPKSLCGVPHLYHLSLAYGRNLLTGEESPAGRWRVRNVVAWCRPNPPVGALGDKFRPATSYMTIACREGSRYFDLDAVRGPGSPNTHARTAKGVESRPSSGKTANDERRGGNWSTLDTLHDTNGAPPLDYWVIPTQPYSGSHYAVYPPALVERPIKSMVPAKVCLSCDKPMTHDESIDHWMECPAEGEWEERNGVVLDPFAGSGTTLMVATGHGRDAIGIDLDARNADLALDRVGPLMLTVEHHAEDGAA